MPARLNKRFVLLFIAILAAVLQLGTSVAAVRSGSDDIYDDDADGDDIDLMDDDDFGAMANNRDSGSRRVMRSRDDLEAERR